jgi:hypothetical protein
VSHLRLVSDAGSRSPSSGGSSTAAAAGSRNRPPQLRLVADTGSRYRPPVPRSAVRPVSIMPRWVSLTVSAGAALASILVAVIGFEAGAPSLGSRLDPFPGGQSAWAEAERYETTRP